MAYPTHKSKSEIKLCRLIRKAFKHYKILQNDLETCNGLEIDICIPQLKIAIEWNGIFHREPIYGYAKLNHIKKNDKAKRKILSDKGWAIITIHDIDSKNPVLYSTLASEEIIKFIKSKSYNLNKSLDIVIEKNILDYE